jgi:predicted O-methyltransferase YrrM
MPLDARFQQAVTPLFVPGMGTEHVGPLLYNLVRMTRPRRVLEVGLGYTSPFLAQALADAMAEDGEDRHVLEEAPADDMRRSLLRPENFQRPYAPRLHAIDDFSGEGTSAPRVLETLRALGIDGFVQVHKADFRGYVARIDHGDLPFDFVWFDAGGPLEYIDFLREYWPLIAQDHGLLLLHFTYWNLTVNYQGRDHTNLLCGSIANEIKRQQLHAGVASRFEVLSLVEPHKSRQGSLTMVRKLAGTSLCRDRDFRAEMQEIYGAMPPPMPVLK